MPTPSNEYLTSDELRLLTHRGTTEMQINQLLRMGVKIRTRSLFLPIGALRRCQAILLADGETIAPWIAWY